MRRLGILTTLAVLVLGTTPAQAHRHHHKAHRHSHAVAFQGSCSFHVDVRFAPPLGALPRQGTDFARGAGPCTGSFTDGRGKVHRLDGARVGYVATDSGPSSCAEGAAQGGGYLSYRGSRLRFRLTETRAAAAATLRFEGARSGSAAGDARVSPDSDPSQVVQSCLGTGLAGAAVDIDFATTPAISG
jgi:hypothetical protein